MADAVRIANGGFHGEKDRPKGGSYMDGYRKAGYFFVWLRDNKDPDFCVSLIAVRWKLFLGLLMEVSNML